MSLFPLAGPPAATLTGMASGGALPLQASSDFTVSDLLTTALPDLATLQQTLGDFTGYSQHARLLQFQTEGIELPWLVEHWHGREALNAPFVHELTLLLMQARIGLDDLIGRVATLTLLQADGSQRRFGGIVESVAQLGSDGGLVRYGLTLVPATHYATLQGGAFVWQDLSAETISDRILARYAPHLRHRWQLSRTLAPRSLCVQYQETDWQFLTRLWSEEGLSYYYEHDPSGVSGNSSGSGGNSGSGHTLVIIDREHDWPDHRAITYGRVSSALGDDHIDRLSLSHALATGTTTCASWDYKTLTAPAGSAADSLYPNAPTLEDYSGSGAYRYADADAAQHHAERAQAAYRQRMQIYQGGGAVRSLGPAQRFTLTEHADFIADYDYLLQALGQNANDQPPELIVLAIEHHAANNLVPGLQHPGGLGDMGPEPGSYRNTFSAVRADAPIVPVRQPRPAAMLQTALVTGLPDSLPDANTTERDHRIKLQFHWQRGSQPNPGGHADTPIADLDAASGQDSSHTWVRVAEWLAGPNWGSHFLPRIGDEVLVDFIDADPDRPVVIGSVHNPQDLPPYSAGEDSPANHGGTVSGIHTRGLDGADYARTLFDDAQSQLRTQLKTGYHASQLNLGHIIQQAPHNSQRGAWRGSGLELKTDGWAILRASLGILLTTSARPGSGQHAPSTQMDSAEAITELAKVRQLAHTLIQGASAHGIAQHDLKPLTDYSDSLDQTYSAPVGGHSQNKHQPTERTDSDPVERSSQPLIHLDAPAPTLVATPASSLHYAAQDHSTLVQGDLQHTAQASVSQVAGGTLSLYTDQAQGSGQALQIKAGNGPVSLQAHTDALDLKADQSLKIISVDDEIHITAQNRITLTAADSQIELNGMNITFKTPGVFKAQSGGQDNAPGQGSGGVPLGLPQGQIGELPNWIELRYTYEDLEPVQGATYKVRFHDGSVRSGTLDATGFARIEGVTAGVATVEYGEDVRPWQPPPERKNPDFGAATDETAAARLYEKYVGDKA